MATVQLQRKNYEYKTDPETGCVQGYNDYEQCRTNYFLKQQNEILKKQQSVSNNGDGDTKVMGTTTAVQTQQPNNNLAAVTTAAEGFNPSLAYLIVLIATIIATAVITRYLTKKPKL